LKVVNLKTLHQRDPLGIGQTPYFSWMMESAERDVIQHSYRLIVSDETKTVWDTGIVESREQSFIEYGGLPLESRRVYTWTVAVRDNKGCEDRAEACFETALLHAEDWKARWVESTIPRENYEWFNYGAQPPPIMFKRDFAVTGMVKKARLYASAYGCYRLYVNNVRPDDREFAPEHTVYRDILYYQTYDVTNLLKNGRNTLSMYVGDGWHLCPQTAPVMENFHNLPAVLYQLEIEYENDRRDIIAADGNERCGTGPVMFSDIFLGEKQDANVPYILDYPVQVRDYGYANLMVQPMPPVRPIKTLPAADTYISPRGEAIVDFGQIVCGRARIKIIAPKGTPITFEYFEVPDKDGNYFNSMIAFQKDIYVSDGEPCEYEAYFTFHGFRYIRVTGMGALNKEDFTAVLLTTEKENAGSFSCSDERLNRLYRNIRWAQANNMMSIPTDCPTREKAGFTGDIQIYVKTAIINENVTPFLSAWLLNLAADQLEDGVVPMTVPFTRLYERLSYNRAAEFGDDRPTGIAGWSDAAVIVPHSMYVMTGNLLILKKHYNTMKRWCDYVIRTAREKRGDKGLPKEIDRYLWNTGFHFGEWLIPSVKEDASHMNCRISAAYTAPIFGYISVSLMSKIAHALQNIQDAAYYSDVAIAMKNAIEESLMKGGKMPEELMGAYVLAIAFDLVPDQYQDAFAHKLVFMLEQNDYRLDTGFLATPYLLDALTKIGRRDLALKVLFQDKPPSWLYQVDKGATAIWENWVAISPDGMPMVTSYDHYAFGCVDEWVFREIAGINSSQPGFRHMVIHPKPDGCLHLCKRSFQSEYGEIAVAWTDDVLKVSIPCNTTATVVWKDCQYEIGSGHYDFK